MNINELSQIVAQDDEGVEVVVYQKNGEPYRALDGTPATFTVLGTESAKYREAKRAHQKRLFRMLRKLRGDQTMDPEVARSEDIKLLASAVVGFHGWDDGKTEIPFTHENVITLLSVEHIFDQVRAGVEGHADFFASASGS